MFIITSIWRGQRMKKKTQRIILSVMSTVKALWTCNKQAVSLFEQVHKIEKSVIGLFQYFDFTISRNMSSLTDIKLFTFIHFSYLCPIQLMSRRKKPLISATEDTYAVEILNIHYTTRNLYQVHLINQF